MKHLHVLSFCRKLPSTRKIVTSGNLPFSSPTATEKFQALTWDCPNVWTCYGTEIAEVGTCSQVKLSSTCFGIVLRAEVPLEEFTRAMFVEATFTL